jgi:hypothetical protein
VPFLEKSALFVMKSALFVQANVAVNTTFLFGNFDDFKKAQYGIV